MITFITTTALGLLVCVFGIINMTGNISTLHSYHRKRVSEEDRKPFGKLVGLGTLIIGVAMIVFGVMMLAFEKTQLDLYAILGTVLLILGIVLGTVISFYAMMKYNKGIF
jgi:hypothetical protein